VCWRLPFRAAQTRVLTCPITFFSTCALKSRKLHLESCTSVRPVERAQISAMQFHRAFRNGEAHSGPAGMGASGVVHAIKGKEDCVELVLRDTRPTITHLE
jgi:hypothetical protein